MNTKRNSHCLSQAIPPIKSWLHSNRLSCLVLATSLLPIASQQVNAAPEWKQNQNIQSTQNNKVTYQGTVIDENGEPLPGVNITYKNANGVGVITDIDGKFSIAIPQNIHSLIFSYVGMKTQTVRVSSPSEKIKVRLEPDAVSLQETVITGIYTRKAESFTGSMATYSEKDLKTVGNQNVLQSLKALEPLLSQNITQLQIPINNQLITIIIKSKYYRISLAISIFGCIFGCGISNTPSHEHQTKHHFCT